MTMFSSPHTHRLGNRREGCRGFTILEIAIVLAIMGIITAIALPAFERMQRNTRFSALINDLRVLGGAFQHYNSTNGGWPSLSTTAGVVPEGMQDFLRETNWTKTTIFGGGYVWEKDVTHNGRKVRAAIAIQPTDAAPVSMTRQEMAMFDTQYDDGNLATGFFQAGYLDLPLYVIEDDPAYVAATNPGDTADDQAAADAAAKAAAEAKAAADKAAADKAAADQAAAEAAAKAAAEAQAAAEKAAAEAAAAAAEQAKADAIKNLQDTQSAAVADLKSDEQRLKDLEKWADKLDLKVPKNLKNRLEDVKDAVEDLKDATVDSKKLTTYIQDFLDAQAAMAKALTQYEATLQAAQDKEDKKGK